jgi:hypothetical protein
MRVSCLVCVGFLTARLVEGFVPVQSKPTGRVRAVVVEAAPVKDVSAVDRGNRPFLALPDV